MKITFIASSKETEKFVAPPSPSKEFIPEWYTQQKHEYKKNPRFNNLGKLDNANLRMCMPFLDSLTCGYTQKTWCDIYIERDKENEGIKFYYPVSPAIMAIRKNTSTVQYPKEYYPFEFVWFDEWITKTPKGYSVLITHPLNRMDLPFTTMSGIIDSDLYHHAPSGKLPFLIKNEFEGLIPAGTPMYQIIPIKRDNWEKTVINHNKDSEKRHFLQNAKFWEFYKTNFWQKKRFN